MNTTEFSPGRIIGGITLIFLGMFFLLEQMDIIPEIGNLWPIFMILFGFALLAGYFFKRDNSGILFVGSLVSLNGFFFMFWNLDYIGRYDMGELWPIFILIPGVSFILMALVSKEEKKALIPGVILIVISIIFLLNTIGDVDIDILRFIFKFWPIILVLIGIKLLLQYRKSNNS